MTPAQIQSIIRIIVTIFIVLILWFGINYVLDLRKTNEEQASTIASQNQISQATSEIAAQSGAETRERDAVNITLTDQRSNYNQAYQELKNENITIAEYLSRPVPNELRELARQRCLARDRLGVGEVRSGCIDSRAPDPRRPTASIPGD
jgi:hypothetical protein